ILEPKMASTTSLDSLPIELRCKIISMAEESIRTMRLVCRKWCYFVSEWTRLKPLPPIRRLRVEDHGDGIMSVAFDVDAEDVMRFEDLKGVFLHQ
ncbi:hypothetical protein PFISCL1PPCAC_11166, partial [Pristionchus fissidentatus]